MEAVIRFLARLFGWKDEDLDLVAPGTPQKPPEAPKPPDMPVIPPPVIKPVTEPITPPMTNRERLYRCAKESLGVDMSPLDLAPDMLGCAESINGVFIKTFGKPILKNVVSTAALLIQLKKDPRFQEVATPFPGDIVINATGTSTKGAKNGHVGVWGNNSVMSNDSFSGKWSANYTHLGWIDYFQVKLGFPTRYFRVK